MLDEAMTPNKDVKTTSVNNNFITEWTKRLEIEENECVLFLQSRICLYTYLNMLHYECY